MKQVPASVRKRSLGAIKKKTSNGVAVHKSNRKWSAAVARNSNALDLKARVFLYKDPEKIAASLKKAAEKSKHKKGSPFQSAMARLSIYINRAGKKLTLQQRKPLEKAKDILRTMFTKNTK